MREELENELVKDFRTLFESDYFCFECGDGWYEIIRSLLKDLCPMVSRMSLKDVEEDYLPKICQIKEKFGSLCVYMDSATDEMFDRINLAVNSSCFTCEVCGEPGKIGIDLNKWYECRCESCRAK